MSGIYLGSHVNLYHVISLIIVSMELGFTDKNIKFKASREVWLPDTSLSCFITSKITRKDQKQTWLRINTGTWKWRHFWSVRCKYKISYGLINKSQQRFLRILPLIYESIKSLWYFILDLTNWLMKRWYSIISWPAKYTSM